MYARNSINRIKEKQKDEEEKKDAEIEDDDFAAFEKIARASEKRF